MAAVALIVVVAGSLWVKSRGSGSTEPTSAPLASTSLASSAAPVAPAPPVTAADGRPPSELAAAPAMRGQAAAARVTAPAAANGVTAQINAAVRAPHADTALLATVARRRHAIPPEVDELIRRHQAGASPKELEQWLRDHPIKDIGDRVAVLHWLREIGPDDGATPRDGVSDVVK